MISRSCVTYTNVVHSSPLIETDMITGADIKQTIDAIKVVADIANKAGKIPEFGKILELQAMLLEIQEGMAEKQRRIEMLEKENIDLKNKFHLAKKMEFRDNAYYDGEDGPFCSACWDTKQMKVRLETSPDNSYATCHPCNIRIRIKSERSSSIAFGTMPNYDPYQF